METEVMLQTAAQRVVEISAKSLFDTHKSQQVYSIDCDQPVALVIDDSTPLDETELLRFHEYFKNSRYVLAGTRDITPHILCQKWPSWLLQRLYFLPIPYSVTNPASLTCRETFQLLSSLRNNYGLKLDPLDYREYMTSNSINRVDVLFKSKLNISNPFWTIIIPTRNGAAFLLNVVQHLIEQNIDYTEYEVIVIDDHGEDQSFTQLQGLVGPIANKFQITYLYRHRSKNSPDEFNAGLCRNEGLYIARGEWVLFLDSDMLLPTNFLSKLKQQTDSADVIQCPRRHIVPEKSLVSTRLNKLLPSDFYIEEAHYWSPFFDSAHWSDVPNFWKYTCTYCLAIRKSSLNEVGYFRTAFRSYGFEDTDLGYRLFKAKKKFFLFKEWTYHLTPSTQNSRYHHSIMHKHFLLQRTAKVFYFSNLDEDIFNLFSNLMLGESRILQKLFALITFIKNKFHLFRV